ncbi:magnesium ion transporter [Hypoxylon texense]
MELTPITNRGKRPRPRPGPDDLPSAPPKKRVKVTSNPVSTSKPTLKLKLTLETKPKPKRKPKSAASLLETEVPLEVMEKIFWLSGPNLNLPRASHHIGRLLSNPSTMKMTFIKAFEHTWYDPGLLEWDVHRDGKPLPSEGSGIPWFVLINPPKDGRDIAPMPWPRHVAPDPELQSALLERPCVTVSFIHECWEIFAPQAAEILKEWAKLIKMPVEGAYISPLAFIQEKMWGIYPGMPKPRPGCFFETRSVDILANAGNLHEPFLEDYAALRQIENCADEEYFRMRGVLPFTHLARYVHKKTRIPDSLFLSPFDEESLQKLFWVIRGGALLAEDQTWELTHEAYRRAVADDWPSSGRISMTMVRLLYLAGAFKKWPKSCLDAELPRWERFLIEIEKSKDKEPLLQKLASLKKHVLST